MPIPSDSDWAILQKAVQDARDAKRWTEKFKIEGPNVTGRNGPQGASYVVGGSTRANPAAGNPKIWARLVSEDPAHPGHYSYFLSDRNADGSFTDNETTIPGYNAVEVSGVTGLTPSGGNWANIVLATEGVVRVQLIPNGNDDTPVEDGGPLPLYAFARPLVLPVKWFHITGSTLLGSGSTRSWSYDGYTCDLDTLSGTDTTATWFDVTIYSGMRNIYEFNNPTPSSSIYTNGVKASDLTGTIDIQPLVGGQVYKLEPIFTHNAAGVLTDINYFLNTPNGVTGGCS